jgi:hypothetical protein
MVLQVLDGRKKGKHICARARLDGLGRTVCGMVNGPPKSGSMPCGHVGTWLTPFLLLINLADLLVIREIIVIAR